MARILMAGLPAFGLANPSLPLAAALVEAGHTVDFLQGESFRQRVERTGATLIPFGFYLDGPLTEPPQLIRHGKRLFTDMSDAMIKLGPRYDAVVGTGIQPQLPRIERSLDRPVIFASPVFFQNDRTAIHLATIAIGLPAPARRLFRTPVLRRLVVLTTGSRQGLEKLGPVPDNVIARAFVPQVDVLEHADVCFTHGGFGTATDAVTLGVPPVLTPMGADQFFNAYRLQELGAGTVLPKSEFTVESVRKAADEARSGDRAGLMALRESFARAGGPKLGVSRIEALI